MSDPQPTAATQPQAEGPAPLAGNADGILPVERVTLAELRPHPRNYRQHPEGQIDHLAASLDENGFYKNVVVAHEGTILAGHGIVKAMLRKGWTAANATRMPFGPEDPRALKILAGDNEVAKLAEVDDRLLTEVLRDLKAEGEQALLGTGYDATRLAALLFVTRPATEVSNFDEAQEWAGVGMPEFGGWSMPIKVMVNFATEEDRSDFLRQLELKGLPDGCRSIWWPPREQRDDVASIRFEDPDAERYESRTVTLGGRDITMIRERSYTTSEGDRVVTVLDSKGAAVTSEIIKAEE